MAKRREPAKLDPRAVETADDSAINMVTVAYNSPKGIIFKIGGEKAREIHINGNASHLQGAEKGIIPVGRYGYTRVAAEDWEEIAKVYGSMAIFQSSLIFVERSKSRAEDRAEEQKELRHGQEPIDIAETETEEADKSEV